MMKIIVIILFSVVYAFSLLPYLKLENKKIINNLLNISTLVFMLVYGIVFPLNYILSILGYNSMQNILQYSSLDSLDYIIYYLAIILSSHSFLFTLKHRKEITLTNGDCVKSNSQKLDILSIKLTAFILFGIGLVSNYLYLKAYGGFLNYLNYSSLLRSGVMIINNKFSFLYPFRNCILFSSFLYALLCRKEKNNFFSLIMLVCSFILSMTILYANNGRLGIVIYLLLLFLALFKKRYTKYFRFKNILKIGIIGLVCSILITCVGFMLGRNDDVFFINLINKEISFVFLNFSKIRSYCSLSNYRYFFDIISFVFYILPSSIWSGKLNILTSSTINTISWYGSAKGMNGVYGEMPIDFVSLSYMQFGFVGILFLPFIFAIIYNALFFITKKINDSDISQFIKMYILISIGIYSLFYSDPYLIIKRCFAFILFLIIYPINRKIIRNLGKKGEL